MSRVKFYFEPWTAVKAVSHGKPPDRDAFPSGESYLKVLDAWHRSDDNAPWILWGSKMAEPTVCRDLLTANGVFLDDRGIITLCPRKGLPANSPEHDQIAKRIAACVNACAGIPDPEKFIADVRGLVLDLTRGEYDPASDTRAVSLLGRCIPPEEVHHESVSE